MWEALVKNDFSKEPWKSFCTSQKSKLLFHKRLLIISLDPFSLSKPPICFHTTCRWCGKSLLFRHLLSRLAVAINNYLPCLDWEMGLINYTCKPDLILNWIFHWMIQVSLKGSESQPSRWASVAVKLSAVRKGGGKFVRRHICHVWNYSWMKDNSY